MSGHVPGCEYDAKTKRWVKCGDGCALPLEHGPEATEPDWTRPCSTCGAKPILPITGLCGPCTFGEAETSGGNW